MSNQQHSFHIIECPADVSSSHASLVVNGRGVPHQTLTAFYEHLGKTSSPSSIQAIFPALLAFFSFLEEPEQEACGSAPQAHHLPGQTYWAGSPSQLRAAIRAYLLTRWGCLTRANGQQEEVLLPPTASETVGIQHFLAALQQFYRFALETGAYWYESNPAAFHLPLHSRLWHGFRSALRASALRHASSKDEAGKAVPAQKSTPASPREEPALPVEAWLQFVPVSEPVASKR